MVNWQESPDAARQRLSALMDGEAAQAGDDAAWAQACEAFALDDQARADWHVYHLIGDTLRSEDLAQDAGHDAAFLRGFRERLAREPVVLAPMAQGVSLPQGAMPAAVPAAVGVAASAGPRRRHAWYVAPAAVAAGFVAVAGVMVVLRGQQPTAADQIMSLLGREPASVASGGVQATPASLEMIRDTRLEGYLVAHRKVAGGVAVAVPGGVVRNVEAQSVQALNLEPR